MRWIISAVCAIALVFAIGIAVPATNAAPTDNPCVITMDTAPAANAKSPPAATLDKNDSLKAGLLESVYGDKAPQHALWRPAVTTTAESYYLAVSNLDDVSAKTKTIPYTMRSTEVTGPQRPTMNRLSARFNLRL